MKRILAILILAAFSAVSAFALPQATLTRVKVKHHVTHHKAHKAGKHHAPKHHHHTV
ncbi:MAG: hypothetical protein WAN03_12370 [Candidatus Sulfotelmatobacter sp.]